MFNVHSVPPVGVKPTTRSDDDWNAVADAMFAAVGGDAVPDASSSMTVSADGATAPATYIYGNGGRLRWTHGDQQRMMNVLAASRAGAPPEVGIVGNGSGGQPIDFSRYSKCTSRDNWITCK